MTAHYTIIHLDGTIDTKVLPMPIDHVALVKRAQEDVGGPLEGLELFDRIELLGTTTGCVAFCNEEATFEPETACRNDKATAIWLENMQRHGIASSLKTMPDYAKGKIVVISGPRGVLEQL